MPLDFAAFKSGFFDTEKVKKVVAAGDRRAQAKGGAYVRRRARSSIRKRKKSAPPGKPPSSHNGQLKLIFFAWDEASESTVIGPVRFGAAKRQSVQATTLLEKSGAVTRRLKSGESRVFNYRGNAFMKPALDAELPKFCDAFKGGLR